MIRALSKDEQEQQQQQKRNESVRAAKQRKPKTTTTITTNTHSGELIYVFDAKDIDIQRQVFSIWALYTMHLKNFFHKSLSAQMAKRLCSVR